MNEHSKRSTISESIWLGVLGALGLMAWGLWVNWEFGMASRIQVLCTQGGIAFAATAGSAWLLSWIVKWFWKLGWLLSSAAGWLVINGIVAIIHWIAGTPELWMTMLPGMMTGVPFCLVYTRRLRRLSDLPMTDGSPE